MKVSGGLQRIQTNDGYVHPLDIKGGLPYISIRPYTDKEWETLPHVIWTSDEEWDPTVLDHTIKDDEEWYDATTDMQEGIIQSPFDEFGNYRKREVDLHFFDAEQGQMSDEAADYAAVYHATEHQMHAREPNYEALHPFFLYQAADVVKCTFQATMQ